VLNFKLVPDFDKNAKETLWQKNQIVFKAKNFGFILVSYVTILLITYIHIFLVQNYSIANYMSTPITDISWPANFEIRPGLSIIFPFSQLIERNKFDCVCSESNKGWYNTQFYDIKHSAVGITFK